MVHNGDAKCSTKTLIQAIDEKTISEDENADSKVSCPNMNTMCFTLIQHFFLIALLDMVIEVSKLPRHFSLHDTLYY